jgi:hypothetical protein
MPDNTAGAPVEVLAGTHRGYIDFLARYSDLDGDYLEIGPDIGLAAAAACELGTFSKASFVEPNLAVHDVLERAAGAIPVEIFSSVSELSTSVRANVVVSIHVLDHLIDPLAHLKQIHEHVDNSAELIFVVHNEGSLLRKALGAHWPPFTLQHPQLFSPATLRATLAAEGFEIVGESSTHNVSPLSHLVKTAAAIVGLDGPWSNRLPMWKIRLRLGNIMAVVRS